MRVLNKTFFNVTFKENIGNIVSSICKHAKDRRRSAKLTTQDWHKKIAKRMCLVPCLEIQATVYEDYLQREIEAHLKISQIVGNTKLLYLNHNKKTSAK